MVPCSYSGEVFYIDNSGLATDMVRVFDDWNLKIVESSYVDRYRALCYSSPVGKHFSMYGINSMTFIRAHNEPCV